jgi:hypothetical protein
MIFCEVINLFMFFNFTHNHIQILLPAKIVKNVFNGNLKLFSIKITQFGDTLAINEKTGS